VQADSDPRQVGDEPVLLAARTGRPVVAGPDRVAAGRYLLSKASVDVLLADDGLQHYRLRRAFEIAIVDGRRGFGNGLCLPAGPLRELPSRLTEVDAVVVMNGSREGAAAQSSGLIGQDPLVDRSAGVVIEQPRDAETYRARLEPTRVYRLTGGDEASLGDFAGRNVHAVAGIGHPDRFFEMLERAGAIVTRHPLADHAQIRNADLLFEPGVPVMMTEKDAVKCRDIGNENVWCVAVEVVFEREDAQRLLDAVLAVVKRGDGGDDRDGTDGGAGKGRSYDG
jgi:tetraacyldisaccharide 4'-kinase